MGIRTWLAGKVADAGIGVLGEQLDRTESKLEQVAIELDSLRERFTRIANRIQMRSARAARGGAKSDEEILQEIELSAGGNNRMRGARYFDD